MASATTQPVPAAMSASIRETASQSLFEIREAVLGYFLLELALWNTGWRQLAWGIAALTSIIWLTARGTRNRNELGLGCSGLRRSLAVVPAAAALAILGAWCASWAGTLHLARGLPLWHAGLYATWAMVQEFLLQSFIFVRLERLIGGRQAILATAGVFAAAHLPNPLLMAATFVMGLALSYWFWRHRNLYALGIAHALLGLCLAVSLPETLTHGMHVGASYFAAEKQIPAILGQSLQRQPRTRWVKVKALSDPLPTERD